jgi:hypothetical protein
MTDHNGLQAVPSDGKLNPIMALEQRPSRLTGISFWLVLAYKDHVFEELLPEDFMGMDEVGRDLVIARAGQILKDKLRPILLAEDGESMSIISGHT